MKKNSLILLSMVICLLISGCVSVIEPINATESIQPESIAANTVPENPITPTIPATPTQELVAETPLPTKSLPSTLTPTPTEILPVEWDVDPYIIKDIEGEYRGVKIKARFIVDRSLEDIVESVEINENLYAEMIVKILATVWYAREKTEPWEIVQPVELFKWIDVWAKAQETGSEYYWSQVQLNRIWANDLNDGNAYLEKSYNFRPMYEGVCPYGVTAIDKITFVVLDVDKSNIFNVDTFSRSETKSRLVGGSNVDNQNLYYYTGRDTNYNAASIMEWHKYDYNPYTPISATRFALQLNLYIFPNYLIFNDKGDNIPDGGPGLSLGQLMNMAVKYKLRGE